MIRIVKLHIRPEEVNTFKEIFEETKAGIVAHAGCEKLELLQDRSEEGIFFTYSWWTNPEDLEAYRQSDFFAAVWKKTKALFAGKAEAWSVDRISIGK